MNVPSKDTNECALAKHHYGDNEGWGVVSTKNDFFSQTKKLWSLLPGADAERSMRSFWNLQPVLSLPLGTFLIGYKVVKKGLFYYYTSHDKKKHNYADSA